MASFSFGYLIAPLLMTFSLYQYCGRRGATQIGLLVLSLALSIYALAYFIPDTYTFLFVFISILG